MFALPRRVTVNAGRSGLGTGARRLGIAVRTGSAPATARESERGTGKQPDDEEREQCFHFYCVFVDVHVQEPPRKLREAPLTGSEVAMLSSIFNHQPCLHLPAVSSFPRCPPDSLPLIMFEN